MWAQDATQRQPQPGDQAQAQQPATKSFAGKIVKQGDGYVLKDSANRVTYELDGQDHRVKTPPTGSPTSLMARTS